MFQKENPFGSNPLAYHKPSPPSHIQWTINKAAHLIRLVLAGIFFWSGILKLTGVSPVMEMLRHSMPPLAEYPYIQLLAMAEVLIAMGLVIDKLSRPASAMLMVNLLLVLGIIAVAPALVFAEDEPGLTAHGAFLANYILFTLAGLLILSWRQRSAIDLRPAAAVRPRRNLSRPLY